jgi:hypothetical protein
MDIGCWDAFAPFISEVMETFVFHVWLFVIYWILYSKLFLSSFCA